MIEVNKIRHQYNEQNSFVFPDFQCQPGGQVLILGQSGCGKTTLLHILGGLLKPSSGQVIIQGEDLWQMTGAHRDTFRGKHIGIIFQQAHFLRAVNVTENLAYAQTMARKPVDKPRIEHLLKRLALGHKIKDLPGRLSMGEQQRVAIARALVNKPKLLLADEPTSALDDYNCKQVIHLLRELSGEEQAALVIVTHDNRLKSEFNQNIILSR